jgi:hypothetical protein
MREPGKLDRSGRSPWAAALLLGALALGAPLRADLGGRLTVAAHALAARPKLARQPLALGSLRAVDGQAYAPGEQALLDALRRALLDSPGLTLRPEGAVASGSDLVLDGDYQAGDGGLSLTLRLHPAAGGDRVWSRTLWIPDADLPAGDAAAPAVPAPPAAGAASADPEPMASDDGMVVPSLRAGQRARRPHRPFHLDLSAAYQAFMPLNSSFQAVAGSRQDGVSLGLSIQDWFLADLVAWHRDLNGPGTLQALDYYGVDLAVVAPLHLGPITLYAGPGGRFGSIEVSDSAVDSGSTGFGNNGFVAVGGVKARAGSVGLDLRYSYDLASTYTGYHTIRLGAFYEFGR